MTLAPRLGGFRWDRDRQAGRTICVRAPAGPESWSTPKGRPGGPRKNGFVISNGYGKLKGRTFRIGHLGDHSLATLDRLLDALGR